MKYLLKTLLILLIILFSLKLIAHIFNKEHQVKYTIGNFEITENFTVEKKHNYYFNIKSEDFKINFQIFKNYNKAKKVISKIEYYDEDGYKCILPIFKNNEILTDIMCVKDDTITYYHDMQNNSVDKFAETLKKVGYNKNDYNDNAPSKKLSNTQSLYERNLAPNHYLAIENYKGVTLINNTIKTIKLFESDTYKKPVSIFTDKYYVVADYNEKYSFKKFYTVNLINGKITEIRSYNEISFDSIIEGAVNDDIYIFDKDAEIQYKLNIKDETIEKISDEIKYYNGKWGTMALNEALSGKIFDNYYSDKVVGYDKVNKIGKKQGFYYLYKKDNNKYLVYRADVQNPKITTYLFTTTNPNSVIYLNDYIYFKNGTTIYYYTQKGVRKVIDNSELEFNDDISFGVYTK